MPRNQFVAFTICRRSPFTLPLLPLLLWVLSSCGPDGPPSDATSGNRTTSGDLATDARTVGLVAVIPPTASLTNPEHAVRFAVHPDADAAAPSFEWSIDGRGIAPESGEEILLDAAGLEPGTHAVRVRIRGAEGASCTVGWELQLPLVAVSNRPPWIAQAVPPGDFDIGPGEVASIRVVVADVDAADRAHLQWSLDGVQLARREEEVILDAARLGEGEHLVEVEVSDGRGHVATTASTFAWRVQVRGSGAPAPRIARAWPEGNPRVEESGRIRFRVGVQNPLLAPVTCRWEVDGAPQAETGEVFEWDTTIAESGPAGNHRISCSLAEGDAPAPVGDAGGSSAAVSWVVVLDPARTVVGEREDATGRGAPVVRGSSPEPVVLVGPSTRPAFRFDALDPDGDVLTYSWRVGGVHQRSQDPVAALDVPRSPEGEPVRVEVRAWDGRGGEGDVDRDALGTWEIRGGEAGGGAATTLAAGAVIRDNGQPGTSAVGIWNVSGAPSPYGASSLYSKSTGGTYSYDLSLPTAGQYEVLLWWTAVSSRPPAAPVEIVHGAGTATVAVDQRSAGGQWNSLGTWSFGSTARVTIRSVDSQYSTCADAVCLNPVGTSSPPPGEIVIDDGSPGTSSVGTWTASGAPNPYGGRSLYAKTSGSYVFSRSLSSPATYDVYAWWTQLSSRERAVPYDIAHSGGTATVPVDQTVRGGQWNLLGRYSFGSTVRMTVRVVGTGSVCADAVRLVLASGSPPPPTETPGEIVIDDGAAGTSKAGTWKVSGAPNPYGAQSLYASVSGSYVFSRALASPATYDVYAWWTQWASRERAVPYEILHAGGTATVHVDQTAGGGRWNLLGRYSFGSTARVTVRVVGTGSVCADAVRLVPASGSPPPPTSRQVTLAWDPPTTNADGTPITDLAGFRLYWGTASRSYGSSVDAGLETSRTVPLSSGGTYYFAVRAYDADGNSSEYSAEISTMVP